MLKKIISSRIWLLGVVVLSIIFIFSACQKDNQTILNPQTDQKPLTFSKESPQVRAVMEIQNKHTDRLLKLEDVIGTATSVDNEGKLVIKILTKSEKAKGLPSMLDGIPVVIDNIGEVKAFALTKRYTRPVPIGVSIGNINECAAGTLGCAVEKAGTRYILTNNHVIARENKAALGEAVVQPGRYDNKPVCALKTTDIIGNLADFQTIVFSTSANNVIDAAIATTTPEYVGVSTLSTYYGTPSATIVAPSVGMAIMKVGRTTSQTTGTITGINVTINVGYSSGTARFVNQIMTSKSFSKSGDSGSLVVTNPGKNPVGLLFAGATDGTTFCNPISEVLQKFNVSIATQ
ncbi:MAG: hypothetical protein IGBAC_2049 [Ignavibacteriae bacterium]|nr:MAG: hypothetical protein IGBAC_2049 [Ignavibacteriota bacterium]